MSEWSRYNDFQIDPSSQIRVLELQPSRGSEPLLGYMKVHDPETPEYEALSYTWGGSVQGETITLNDQPGFAVTDNLYNALRRLRRPDRTRTLWVDAICINQANLHEQSRQVQLMGTVYRNASQVLIWLGEADEPSTIDASPFQPPQDAIFQSGTRQVNRPSDAVDCMMRSHDAAISSNSPAWWTRTWVIQEVVLAKNPVVCFGEFEVTWSDVGTMREDMSVLIQATLSSMNADTVAQSEQSVTNYPLSLHNYINRYRATNFDEAYTMLDTLRAHNRTWASLSELASTTSRSEATDPRDRVFGYFGLWSGSDLGLMTVSYEKATPEVFADATFADMQAEGNLQVLNLVRPKDAHRRGFPTWTLDFSFQGCDAYIPVIPKVMQPRRSSMSEIRPILSPNSRSLTVSVIVIDRVKTIRPLPRSSLYPLPEEGGYLEQIMRSVPSSNSYSLLRHSLSRIEGDSTAEVVYRRMPPKVELAYQLGVQTDPISDIFLWWLMQATQVVPEKKDFTDLYEWWRVYAKYQLQLADAKSRQSSSAFYCSSLGFIGKCLPSVQPGDKICFFNGLEVPAVIRPVNSQHAFVGLTWLNGAMMGELDNIFADAAEQGCVTEEQIILI